MGSGDNGGLVRDGLVAVLLTTVMETEGLGAAYAGTALGLSQTLSLVGGVVSPPIGNALAGINPSLSFIFWGGLAAVALLCFYSLKETGRKQIALSN